MKRISTKLTLIILLHLLLVLVNGGFLMYQLAQVQDDALVINQAGVVRGTLQRIAKLESNSISAEEHFEEAEESLRLLEGHIPAFTQGDDDRFAQGLERIQTEWRKQKKAIHDFRESGTPENQDRLLRQSEVLWELSNHQVFLSQRIAESKQGGFRVLFLILSIDLLVIVSIIWIVKSMVRDRLEMEATFDALTGAFNRGVHEQLLVKAVHAARRYDKECSYLLLDIDHFKDVNDEHGHYVGDMTLQHLAEVIAEQVRESDSLCRVGGEEFAVIMPETGQEQALHVAERIRAAASEPPRGLPPVTVSIGAATLRQGEDGADLVKRADVLLYKAKDSGRNRVQGE
jgi:diguanylate cyclase (GGDEF)-like protein